MKNYKDLKIWPRKCLAIINVLVILLSVSIASCFPAIAIIPEVTLPATVQATITFPSPGCPAYLPGTQITSGGILNGAYNGWCIDPSSYIYQKTYTANVYSTYDSLPAGLVDIPDNLDLVNWIINQKFVGKTSPYGNGVYTFGDVQVAIWTLTVSGCYPKDSSQDYYLFETNAARINEIVTAAQTNGDGYEPGYGDALAVIIQPTNGAQVFIIEVPSPFNEPTVYFKQSAYTVSEDAGSITLDVIMDWKTNAPVTITYDLEDGTAVFDEDYSPSDGNLVIPAGATSGTITVIVKNDGKYSSPDEYFKAKLTGISGPATIGTPSEATVTLTEADGKPGVELKEPSYTVNENGVNAVLDVTMSGKTSAPVVVHYRTNDGTAKSGINYTGTTDGTVTFPAGSNADQQITVPVQNDLIYGGDTQFTVELFEVSDNAVIGSPASATVTIEEDEIPKVFFKQPGYTVGESDGTVTLDVSLNYVLDSNVVVHYRTLDFTAINNTNFAGTSDGTITFPAGSNADQQIVVDITKDNKYGGDPQFKVELYSISSGSAIIGSPAVATVTIDEELPDVELIQTKYTVGESAGKVVIGIRLSEPSTMNADVYYDTGDGSATDPDDYTGATLSSHGTIAAMNLEGTIEVPIIDDLENEADESFGVILTGITINGADKGVSGMPSASVTIEDNDPLVRFSQSSYTANEGDGKVTLGLALDYAADHAITVYYDVMTTTSAQTPDDFTDPNSGVLVIPAGQATTSFDLNIVDDSAIEDTEGFGVKLNGISVSGVDANGRIGSPGSASVYIQDNDALPLVQFKLAGYTIDEDDGSVTLDVTLSKAASTPVVVSYRTADGTALSGVNYTGMTDGTITFPAGSTADQQIIVPILDDDIFGGNTFFFVNLTGVSSGNADIGSPDVAQVTINEDDPYIVYVYNKWALVSWPVVNNSIKASDLTDNETLGVTIVAIYDPVGQTFKSYTRGDPSIFDFSLGTDMGIFLWGDHYDGFPVYGPLSSPHLITLYPDWNLIGWSSLSQVYASDITDSNANVQIIARYDVISQSYQSYTVGDPSIFDFVVRDGEGYFIKSAGSEPVDFLTGGINIV